MRHVQHNKYDLPKDAPSYMEDFAKQLRADLKSIANATGGQGGTTTILSANGAPTITLSGNNTSNGAPSVSVDFRANQVAVVAGSNTITFAKPMTSDYVIIPIYISSMIEFIDPTQIVYDMNKFTVIVPNDGLLVYGVLPKTSQHVPIQGIIIDQQGIGGLYDRVGVPPYNNQYGGSFTGDGSLTKNVKFYVDKMGIHNCSIKCNIFAHSGIYGVTSVGTGLPLTTSGIIDLTDYQDSGYFWIDIPLPYYQLIQGTKYVISLEYVSGGGYIRIDKSATPTNGGNSCWRATDGTWTYTVGQVSFTLYGVTV